MSQLNTIYEKQHEKKQLDTDVGEIETLMKKLKESNIHHGEFLKNVRAQNRLKYTNVREEYFPKFYTQYRFELLFKIIEAQQKMITSLK
jgi:hypothetical protein